MNLSLVKAVDSFESIIKDETLFVFTDNTERLDYFEGGVVKDLDVKAEELNDLMTKADYDLK